MDCLVGTWGDIFVLARKAPEAEDEDEDDYRCTVQLTTKVYVAAK